MGLKINFLVLDLLGPVLCGDQPVQASAHLHRLCGSDVHEQAPYRDAASFVRRLGRGLQKHAAEPREPVDADHWRVGSRKDREHQEGVGGGAELL